MKKFSPKRELFVFVSKLFHYKDRSKFFLICALNFSLHPPHVKFYSNTGK